MQITFSSQFINGNFMQIQSGKSFFDFTTGKDPKIYTLNLTKEAEYITDETVNIYFSVYSGYPTISISLTDDFKKTLNYKQISGSINYLITPKVREQFNYTGNVYIKV